MDYRIQTLVDFVRQNHHRKISPEEVAQLVNLSTSRVQHLFKKETGLSIIAYQKKLQIEKARALLSQTVLSVKEVCTAIGAQHPNRFSKEFKQVIGTTPTQYRKALLQDSVVGKASKQASKQQYFVTTQKLWVNSRISI